MAGEAYRTVMEGRDGYSTRRDPAAYWEMPTWPAGRFSAILCERCLRGRLVLGVKLECRVQAAALLFDVVCFRRQPEPGLDHEGAGAVEVADYEPGNMGTGHVDRDVAVRVGAISSPLRSQEGLIHWAQSDYCRSIFRQYRWMSRGVRLDCRIPCWISFKSSSRNGS